MRSFHDDLRSIGGLPDPIQSTRFAPTVDSLQIPSVGKFSARSEPKKGEARSLLGSRNGDRALPGFAPSFAVLAFSSLWLSAHLQSVNPAGSLLPPLMTWAIRSSITSSSHQDSVPLTPPIESGETQGQRSAQEEREQRLLRRRMLSITMALEKFEEAETALQERNFEKVMEALNQTIELLRKLPVEAREAFGAKVASCEDSFERAYLWTASGVQLEQVLRTMFLELRLLCKLSVAEAA